MNRNIIETCAVIIMLITVFIVGIIGGRSWGYRQGITKGYKEGKALYENMPLRTIINNTDQNVYISPATEKADKFAIVSEYIEGQLLKINGHYYVVANKKLIEFPREKTEEASKKIVSVKKEYTPIYVLPYYPPMMSGVSISSINTAVNGDFEYLADKMNELAERIRKLEDKK